MSKNRNIRKTVYSLTIAAAVVAGTLTGYSAKEPERSFYREPYTAKVFSLSEPTKGAERFADMTVSDWFYGYVDTLVKDGIINGKSETAYDPNGTLTLPECAALFVRCLGLENEAKGQGTVLLQKGLAGSDKWYIGYMKICTDMGIVPSDEYGFGYDTGGNFVMKSDEWENRAVKRCELADFLYRMTVLDGSVIKAENTYVERGGYGREFIRSGLYDMAAVQRYSEKIADFEKIPEKFRNSVLCCYYNAVFNGDTSGNFNPENSLTRAEMAKIVSVLTDIGTRFGEDTRENIPVLSESDYRKDIYGNSELRHESGYKILERIASELSLVSGGYLRVPLISASPLGYIAEAHVYANSGTGYIRLGEVSAASGGIVLSGDFTDFSVGEIADAKVIYILRNLSSGKTEGVLEADIQGAQIVFSDGIADNEPREYISEETSAQTA